MIRMSAAAIVAMIAAPAHAQSPHVYGSFGLTWNGVEGPELALGLQTEIADFLLVRASPLNVVLTENPGFYRDQFSNGQSRCRDESNGQFATDGSCTGIDYRVDADAYIRLSPQFLIGGGVVHTVSSDVDPTREGVTDSFGAIMYEWNKNLGLELRAGADAGALRIRLAI